MIPLPECSSTANSTLFFITFDQPSVTHESKLCNFQDPALFPFAVWFVFLFFVFNFKIRDYIMLKK